MRLYSAEYPVTLYAVVIVNMLALPIYLSSKFGTNMASASESNGFHPLSLHSVRLSSILWTMPGLLPAKSFTMFSSFKLFLSFGTGRVAVEGKWIYPSTSEDSGFKRKR